MNPWHCAQVVRDQVVVEGEAEVPRGRHPGVEVEPVEPVDVRVRVLRATEGDAVDDAHARERPSADGVGRHKLPFEVPVAGLKRKNTQPHHHSIFWRDFDVQSTFGVTLPGGALGRLGTPLAWNTAFQYRLIRKLWPELEVNSTFWPNGSRSGKNQVFFTPGLVAGRFHFWGRAGLTFGAGVA